MSLSIAASWGPQRGHRAIPGGRTSVRNQPYMTSLAAIRWNPVIQARYGPLIRRGRPKKVAIVACRRRLLGRLNASLESKTPWRHA
jgi:transposase